MKRRVFYILILILEISTSCETKKEDFLLGDWISDKFELEARHGVIPFKPTNFVAYEKYLPTYFSISMNEDSSFKLINNQIANKKMVGIDIHFKNISGQWTRSGDTLLLWQDNKIWLKSTVTKISDDRIEFRINRVQFIEFFDDSATTFTGDRCRIELQKQNSN